MKDYSYVKKKDVKFDISRRKRVSVPEVIFALGKTTSQIVDAAKILIGHKEPLIISKLDKSRYIAVKKKIKKLSYSETAKIGYIKSKYVKHKGDRFFAVLSAGSGDIPVAEEAALILEILGFAVKRFYDCGVAGIARIEDIIEEADRAKAVICVAGMDGVLPSVIAGLIRAPVIAVPTDIGYGAHFGGVAPLLTMLNSCSPGVAVVNINNGYGAAVFAAKME